MVDKIVELDNGFSYVILDRTILDNRTFYFGLRLDDNDKPSNNYLFFEEFVEDDEVFLDPIEDEDIKGTLLTAFSINYLKMAYDI